MTKIRIYNSQIEVEISGTFIPYDRGVYVDGFQSTPDEPAHYEDIVAKLDGEVIELSEDDTELANDALMEDTK